MTRRDESAARHRREFPYGYTPLDGFHRDYEAANSKSPLGVGGHSIVPYLVHAPSGPNSALRVWPRVEA